MTKKVVTLGEMLLRLSTRTGQRFSQADAFQVHIGGAEANVAINLARWGYHTALATIVPDHPIGQLAVDHLERHQVDTAFVEQKGTRLGTYYLESGNHIKQPKVVYDRAFSSFATEHLEHDDHTLLAGADLLHVTGITLALSSQWIDRVVQLLKYAKEKQVKVSLDMNYRASLWSIEEARLAFEKVLPYIDYCSAGQLDAPAFFGVSDDTDDYFTAMKRSYPNIELFYSTKRDVISASHHKLHGQIWQDGAVAQSKQYDIYPIVDRVGAGDAFTAGVIHGLLSNATLDYTVQFATLNAVLKHSIEGDISLIERQEIEQLLANQSGGISR
ncbi:2-dehydro-3-deoxygluconokinase [Amphibacillus marinus]|uniref:2-dehydro-3-deoxygluconokinase n=1 Tax=Amphibacillus marinus TaxID=872970 RepID=A0A1H8TH32_9BACI|nr:sugar kinase [Amphibacillus marinus]SEO89884.1 2-dehydro-3-deoxygluconokinase [Amphibacillus marinus]